MDMRQDVEARPLALGGAGAIAGVALGPCGPWAVGGCLFLLGLWMVAGRHAAPRILGLALLAGLLAGARAEAGVSRHLAAIPPESAPPLPRPGAVELCVAECGEDPFRGRGWLLGYRGDGAGFLCTWPGVVPAALGPGARVRVVGRFRPPRGARNPGESDGRRRLAIRGASSFGDLRDIANLTLLDPAPEGLAHRLGQVRRAAAQRLRARLPEDVAALMAALLLDVRGGLSSRQRSMFERTGTSHLLAISGMHLVLLAGLMHAALRLLGAGPRLAALLTLAMTLLYVPIAGSGPPVRRAATGVACYALALLRGRPPDSASALGGAALFIALVDPLDIFRVGFQLSFAAAIGIAYLAPAWYGSWSRRHKLLARFPAVQRDRRARLLLCGHLLRALPVTLAAWLSTLALVAHSFGVVTPFAPVVNLVAGPLVSLALPLAALVACVGEPAAAVAVPLARALQVLLDHASRWPGALLALPPIGAAGVAVWTLGLLRLRAHPRSAVALLAAVPLLMLRPPSPGADSFVLLDVGHGQAALLRLEGGGVALLDAGSKGREDACRALLLPALRELGVRRLDTVVLSHADADHWNALPGLLDALPVGRLVYGAELPPPVRESAARNRVPARRAEPGEVLLASPSARLRVLVADDAPAEGRLRRNDRALVLLLEIEGRPRMMLPSDREERGLGALLSVGIPRCEILLAPHHGGACRLAGALGVAVRARVLLVSCSSGFADAAALHGYAQGGQALVFASARHGCLVATFERGPGRPLSLSSFLDGPLTGIPRANIRPP